MKDWNGREIQTARSRGGVLAVAHPLDNLVSTGCSPWPSPEIIQKLYESRQAQAFSGDQHSICTSGLGYYCDLQSLNSEDAITWSVFGVAARGSQQQVERWLADLFTYLDLTAADPALPDVFLWRRIPHPDTLVSGGPEIDAGILTRNSVILVEAKWGSGVGSHQGKAGGKDQIQLRLEFLERYGARIFPQASVKAVVGIGLFTGAFGPRKAPVGVLFKEATWEKVCALPSHPNATELRRYFDWKRKYTSSA